MTITANINLSPWQIAGIAVLYHVFSRNQLNDDVHGAAKNVIVDSPVITFAGSLTFLVHHFTTKKYPLLSLSTLEGVEGSIKVATFVSGVFALKSALSNYLEYAISCKKTKDNPLIIQSAFIHNFLPLGLGVFAAYYAAVPLKLAESALYTAALIGVVKLLGKGYEYANKPDGILANFKYDFVATILSSSEH